MAEFTGKLQERVHYVITVRVCSIVITDTSLQVEWSDRAFKHLKDFLTKVSPVFSLITSLMLLFYEAVAHYRIPFGQEGGANDN